MSRRSLLMILTLWLGLTITPIFGIAPATNNEIFTVCFQLPGGTTLTQLWQTVTSGISNGVTQIMGWYVTDASGQTLGSGSNLASEATYIYDNLGLLPSDLLACPNSTCSIASTLNPSSALGSTPATSGTTAATNAAGDAAAPATNAAASATSAAADSTAEASAPVASGVADAVGPATSVAGDAAAPTTSALGSALRGLGVVLKILALPEVQALVNLTQGSALNQGDPDMIYAPAAPAPPLPVCTSAQVAEDAGALYGFANIYFGWWSGVCYYYNPNYGISGTAQAACNSQGQSYSTDPGLQSAYSSACFNEVDNLCNGLNGGRPGLGGSSVFFPPNYGKCLPASGWPQTTIVHWGPF